MSDPSRARVAGPLRQYAPGLVAELASPTGSWPTSRRA